MKTFSRTDIGRMRRVNQDYIFSSDQSVGQLPNLFIVADGMGGHKAGDYASKYTVERVVELIQKSTESDPEKLITSALKIVNSELMLLADKDPEKQGMGTTFVAATIAGEILRAFNVGDSRLYILNHRIEQITKDHSYVQEMVNNGEIAQKDARNHPQKNVITRAVGVNEHIITDCFERKIAKGDTILLCSDGLTNMVDDAQIEQIVRTGRDPVEKVETLIETANANGGADNISVIYIQPF